MDRLLRMMRSPGKLERLKSWRLSTKAAPMALCKRGRKLTSEIRGGRPQQVSCRFSKDPERFNAACA